MGKRVSFGNVRTAERATGTAVIEMRGLIGMTPRLVCRPATKATPAYFNKVLKRQRIGRGRIDLTVQNMEVWLDDDVMLLPEHCVETWEEGSVVDGAGQPVPFSVEDCQAFFKAVLAADREAGSNVFEDFCADIRDPSIFREAVDPDDVKAQAGN